MLSILIPVYNYNVDKLVSAIMKQCQKEKIIFEVLVYDDNSSEKFKNKNKFLSNIFGVNYLELSENMGRAKIRNWLAKSGLHENLLFLDCDSKIIAKDFIKNYINNINQADLISGGRVYNKKAPRAISKTLHWKYGTKRESRNAKVRNTQKVNYFHSNNFMIKRDVMSKFLFDQNISGYGYEDLIFAKKLDDKGYTILHIDNPVEHLGLEKSSDFLRKNLNAVHNLKALQKKDRSIKIRFNKVTDFVLKYKLEKRLTSYYQKNEKRILENLNSKNPKLYYFDLYRLYHYFNTKISSSKH